MWGDDDFDFFTFDEKDEQLMDQLAEALKEYEEEMKSKKRSQSESFAIGGEVPPKIPEQEEVKKEDDSDECAHKNTVKAHAGGVYYWYCRDCKGDLGDVE